MRGLGEGEVSPWTTRGDCDGLEGELAEGLPSLFVLLLWLLFGLATLFEGSVASTVSSPVAAGWTGECCGDFRK